MNILVNKKFFLAKKEMANNLLVKILGWKATVLHGDPSSFDRWIWLKRHLSPGPLRTLDAGCGSGAYTMYAARIGNEALGISCEERSTEVARERANILGITNVSFVTADLRHLDKKSNLIGKFNQIICFETIEHVLNDKKLLIDLSNILEIGGKLLLTAPYKNHKALLYESLSTSEDGGHVRWGYSYEEIRHLFQEAGLEMTTEEYVSGFITQKLMDLMRFLDRVHQKFAWVVTFPLRLLQIFDAPITRLLNYPYLSIGMIGIKKD